MTPDAIRQQAYARDDAGHFMREVAFANWLASSVYGIAVNRWIREACK